MRSKKTILIILAILITGFFFTKDIVIFAKDCIVLNSIAGEDYNYIPPHDEKLNTQVEYMIGKYGEKVFESFPANPGDVSRDVKSSMPLLINIKIFIIIFSIVFTWMFGIEYFKSSRSVTIAH